MNLAAGVKVFMFDIRYFTGCGGINEDESAQDHRGGEGKRQHSEKWSRAAEWTIVSLVFSMNLY